MGWARAYFRNGSQNGAELPRLAVRVGELGGDGADQGLEDDFDVGSGLGGGLDVLGLDGAAEGLRFLSGHLPHVLQVALVAHHDDRHGWGLLDTHDLLSEFTDFRKG